MLIVYDSLTGNVERFVNKLIPYYKIRKLNNKLMVDEKYILVTYTFDFGNVPKTTKKFLEINGHLLIGVASSGNKIWGDNYCKAADKISQKYNVPIIHKFELAGTTKDVEFFIQEVKKIVKMD